MSVLKEAFFTGTGCLWWDMLSKLLFFTERSLHGCRGGTEVSPQVCALTGNCYNWFAPLRQGTSRKWKVGGDIKLPSC